MSSSQSFKKGPVLGLGLLFVMLGVVIEVGWPLAGIREPFKGGFPHEDCIAGSGLWFAWMAFIVVLA